MEKERVNKKVVSTHKYWIQTYIPVFYDGEVPEDDDAYYDSYENALSEMEQSEMMQPENIYVIKTVRIKDKEKDVLPDN